MNWRMLLIIIIVTYGLDAWNKWIESMTNHNNDDKLVGKLWNRCFVTWNIYKRNLNDRKLVSTKSYTGTHLLNFSLDISVRRLWFLEQSNYLSESIFFWNPHCSGHCIFLETKRELMRFKMASLSWHKISFWVFYCTFVLMEVSI